ncbi:SAM-dependent methyltransferase [Pseudoglutamicibacter albus]|uniref:SAM-dependent methyltransferase n=2 Tax=Pseudoglutamicibacter albus TaxID=98671 RepID=A0ABU1YWS1_9MICC|nr:class I SAM-dependent methyltransferase [Pseudoglutamicibacter albus]MDR7292805.1 SAM-dependent methyltransferase [Pseudoglutamicibacter albus]
MIIETPQGTWTPKVALDHDAGTDQTHTQSPAQSPCPHEKVAKMVAHSSEPPSDTENYEAPGARLFDNPVLYDNIFGWDASEELDFITSTTNADRLIEFGCGSGRVLLPLLERGYQVDGIDSSSDALTYLSEAAAERKTKHTPRLILGDLTEVALLPTYPGAFSALNTVRCLPTPELVAAHLRRAAMSVTTGGKYLIHLDSFGADLTERPQPGEYGEWEGFGNPTENPEYQNITVRWELAKREPHDGYDLETERVRVWNGEELIVDELLLQLSLSITGWHDLFTAEGLWTVHSVVDEDEFQPLDAQQQRTAESGNYWFILERTDRAVPPLYSA